MNQDSLRGKPKLDLKAQSSVSEPILHIARSTSSIIAISSSFLYSFDLNLKIKFKVEITKKFSPFSKEIGTGQKFWKIYSNQELALFIFSGTTSLIFFLHLDVLSLCHKSFSTKNLLDCSLTSNLLILLRPEKLELYFVYFGDSLNITIIPLSIIEFSPSLFVRSFRNLNLVYPDLDSDFISILSCFRKEEEFFFLTTQDYRLTALDSGYFNKVSFSTSSQIVQYAVTPDFSCYCILNSEGNLSFYDRLSGSPIKSFNNTLKSMSIYHFNFKTTGDKIIVERKDGLFVLDLLKGLAVIGSVDRKEFVKSFSEPFKLFDDESIFTSSGNEIAIYSMKTNPV